MPREIVTLNLLRNSGEPWGFRIIGGTDEARILKVDKVSSIACVIALKITQIPIRN